METPMSGTERRKEILELIRKSDRPLSGTALGKETGVSRQVVVQDIALLRTEGYEIVATARGYVLDGPKDVSRLFQMHHTNEQTEDELQTIVDLGGCVSDVMIKHKIYGEMSAPLGIRNRRDVKKFMERLASEESIPMMNITGGYHYHRVTAESEEVLDEIEAALRENGLLS